MLAVPFDLRSLSPLVYLVLGAALGFLAARTLRRGLDQSVIRYVAEALARLDGPLESRREQAGVLLLVAIGEPALLWPYERAIGRPVAPVAEDLLARGVEGLAVDAARDVTAVPAAVTLAPRPGADT